MSSTVAYTKKSVTSKDGTTIGFRQLGRGPAIVILHGGALASQSELQHRARGRGHGAAQDQGGNPAVIADQLRQFCS